MNDDFALLKLAWRDYALDRPTYDGGVISGKSPIKAWREHSWLILACWRGVVQSLLPVLAWEFLREVLAKRAMVRRLWLEEGGWLFTKAGRRRKRRFKGLRKPNPKTLKLEIARAETFYRRALTLAETRRVEMILLAASGAIYSHDDMGHGLGTPWFRLSPRLTLPRPPKSPKRWPRLFHTRVRALMRTGILSQPSNRRLR